MMMRLPELVGAPLSVNALREHLEVNHKTAAHWLDVLERLYAVFRLAPFGAPRIRAVRKERKHYHLDWSLVPDPAARFENLVAAHLLKWVHFRQDAGGENAELRYFRDVTGREVDFVVVEGRRPLMFVECKWDERAVSPALKYLKQRFPGTQAYQVTAVGRHDFLTPEGIRVCPAVKLLAEWV